MITNSQDLCNRDTWRDREIHILLDSFDVGQIQERGIKVLTTFIDTEKAVYNDENKYIYTTLTHFLRWNYAGRLFVHVDGETHELNLIDCEGTERVILPGHNLEKMLISGEFDWWCN